MARTKVGFKNAQLGESLVFCIAQINTSQQPRGGSIGLGFKEPAVFDIEKDRFKSVLDVCTGKRITLEVDECSVLGLLDFFADCAEVNWEFNDDRVIVILPNGDIIGKKRESNK